MEQLFLSYFNSCKETDLKKGEKEFLCDFFKTLNDNDKEAIFMIIYFYHLHEINEEKIEYPFYSEKNKLRGVDFQLAKLPYKLRRMLYKFCKIIESNEESLVVNLSVKKEK